MSINDVVCFIRENVEFPKRKLEYVIKKIRDEKMDDPVVILCYELYKNSKDKDNGLTKDIKISIKNMDDKIKELEKKIITLENEIETLNKQNDILKEQSVIDRNTIDKMSHYNSLLEKQIPSVMNEEYSSESEDEDVYKREVKQEVKQEEEEEVTSLDKLEFYKENRKVVFIEFEENKELFMKEKNEEQKKKLAKICKKLQKRIDDYDFKIQNIIDERQKELDEMAVFVMRNIKIDALEKRQKEAEALAEM